MANISNTRLDLVTGSSRIIPILDDPDSTNGEEQITSTKGMAVDGGGGEEEEEEISFPASLIPWMLGS